MVCEISDVKKSKIIVDTNNRLEFLSVVMALPHIPHGGGGNECFPNINWENYSMLDSNDKISLFPPSITVMVDTANGLPQEIPNSLLTS